MDRNPNWRVAFLQASSSGLSHCLRIWIRKHHHWRLLCRCGGRGSQSASWRITRSPAPRYRTTRGSQDRLLRVVLPNSISLRRLCISSPWSHPPQSLPSESCISFFWLWRLCYLKASSCWWLNASPESLWSNCSVPGRLGVCTSSASSSDNFAWRNNWAHRTWAKDVLFLAKRHAWKKYQGCCVGSSEFRYWACSFYFVLSRRWPYFWEVCRQGAASLGCWPIVRLCPQLRQSFWLICSQGLHRRRLSVFVPMWT